MRCTIDEMRWGRRQRKTTWRSGTKQTSRACPSMVEPAADGELGRLGPISQIGLAQRGREGRRRLAQVREEEKGWAEPGQKKG